MLRCRSSGCSERPSGQESNADSEQDLKGFDAGSEPPTAPASPAGAAPQGAWTATAPDSLAGSAPPSPSGNAPTTAPVSPVGAGAAPASPAGSAASGSLTVSLMSEGGGGSPATSLPTSPAGQPPGLRGAGGAGQSPLGSGAGAVAAEEESLTPSLRRGHMFADVPRLSLGDLDTAGPAADSALCILSCIEPQGTHMMRIN